MFVIQLDVGNTCYSVCSICRFVIAKTMTRCGQRDGRVFSLLNLGRDRRSYSGIRPCIFRPYHTQCATLQHRQRPSGSLQPPLLVHADECFIRPVCFRESKNLHSGSLPTTGCSAFFGDMRGLFKFSLSPGCSLHNPAMYATSVLRSCVDTLTLLVSPCCYPPAKC